MIRELVTPEEIKSSFPVMKQLRSHLNEVEFIHLVLKAQDKEGYKLAALYNEEGGIAAVAGYMPMITLYYGEFIWVCDLVTAPAARSRGYGKQLLTYVHKQAEEHGYHRVALSSGLQRVGAHRFYEEKMEYDKVSYVFLKNLSN